MISRMCFGMMCFGITPVFDYLDYVSDFPGFKHDLVSNGDKGWMRPAMLSHLARYVRDNPGTLKSGRTQEQMLDEWISLRTRGEKC